MGVLHNLLEVGAGTKHGLAQRAGGGSRASSQPTSLEFRWREIFCKNFKAHVFGDTKYASVLLFQLHFVSSEYNIFAHLWLCPHETRVQIERVAICWSFAQWVTNLLTQHWRGAECIFDVCRGSRERLEKSTKSKPSFLGALNCAKNLTGYKVD